jgi:hypothetical protein
MNRQAKEGLTYIRTSPRRKLILLLFAGNVAVEVNRWDEKVDPRSRMALS